MLLLLRLLWRPRDYFSALYVLLFYVTFMESRELSLLIWKMNIVRPNARHLMMSILQMSKQRLREFKNFPHVSQQLGGGAGPWTHLCDSGARCFHHRATPSPGHYRWARLPGTETGCFVLSHHFRPGWLPLPPASQVVGGLHCASTISSNSTWPRYVVLATLPPPSWGLAALYQGLCPKSMSRQQHSFGKAPSTVR